MNLMKGRVFSSWEWWKGPNSLVKHFVSRLSSFLIVRTLIVELFLRINCHCLNKSMKLVIYLMNLSFDLSTYQNSYPFISLFLLLSTLSLTCSFIYIFTLHCSLYFWFQILIKSITSFKTTRFYDACLTTKFKIHFKNIIRQIYSLLIKTRCSLFKFSKPLSSFPTSMQINVFRISIYVNQLLFLLYDTPFHHKTNPVQTI